MSKLMRCSNNWLQAKDDTHPEAKRFRAYPDEPEETLRYFYDSASVMMGTVELREDDIIHISDNLAAATFFRTTPEAMQGRTARALGVPKQYLSMWLDAYHASVGSSKPVRFEYEHEGKGWLKVTVNHISRQRFLYVADDVSNLKDSERALQKANERLEIRVGERTAELERAKGGLEAANERLQYDAMHDALTGLPNRLLFNDRLTQALKRYRRNPKASFAVLFMDLDQFKVVNDSLGHTVGDALLVAASERLSTGIRKQDTVARFGGDEFVVLLEDSDARQVAEVVERLQEAFIQPFELDRRLFTLSVSVGAVLSEASYRVAQELVRDADLAMYQAKTSRSGHHAFFDNTMRQRAIRRLERETELRGTLERRELAVYYQPIIRLDDASLASFEALVRWPHPKHGLLTPDDFIPLAEETGLIVKLDRFVLEAACHQLGRWRHRYPQHADLSVSVNLSSQQFLYPGLVEIVERVLVQNELEPHQLNLELTESLLLQPAASVDLMIDQLTALGVELHLDDFGTGYASLAYLQRFPASTLKIDRSFVQDLSGSERDVALVEGTVALAQRLGLQVVAEGVETDAQLMWLKDMGCEYAQGYRFAKPLTADQAEAFIKVTSISSFDGFRDSRGPLNQVDKPRDRNKD